MIRILLSVAALFIAVLAFAFIVQNRQRVGIDLLMFTVQTPLWIALTGVFLAGFVTCCEAAPRSDVLILLSGAGPGSERHCQKLTVFSRCANSSATSDRHHVRGSAQV